MEALVQHTAVPLKVRLPRRQCAVCLDESLPHTECGRCRAWMHDDCYLDDVAGALERGMLLDPDTPDEALTDHLFLCARCRS